MQRLDAEALLLGLPIERQARSSADLRCSGTAIAFATPVGTADRVPRSTRFMHNLATEQGSCVTGLRS